MRVALVHDYLTQRGGAERVVGHLATAFPGAPVHTALYRPSETFDLGDVVVEPSDLNRFSMLRRHHRLALPLLAKTFSALRIEADVAICSSSGWAHGAKVTGRKIVYCHNPARWLYQPDDYAPGWAGRLAVSALRRRLSEWDQAAAATADRYIVNSRMVGERVRSAYGIDAQLIHPPYGVDPAGPREASDVSGDFALCVSRLMPYKNVDVVIEACQAMGMPLVVVGAGPDEARLRAMSGDDTLFIGGVTEARLRWLYANANVAVTASFEDFGLVPVEAAAFGTPTVALRFGGHLDSIIEGVTGVFFDLPLVDHAVKAIEHALATRWDAAKLVEHAEQFSPAAFTAAMHAAVAEVYG